LFERHQYPFDVALGSDRLGCRLFSWGRAKRGLRGWRGSRHVSIGLHSVRLGAGISRASCRCISVFRCSFFIGHFFLFIVERSCDLQVDRRSKPMIELSVNIPGNSSWEMGTRVSSLCDHNDSETRMSQRRIRSKQPDPTALTDASTSLTGYCLRWIIRLATRTVVHGTDHSRNHSLPNVRCNRKHASYLWRHLSGFFWAAVWNLGYE